MHSTFYLVLANRNEFVGRKEGRERGGDQSDLSALLSFFDLGGVKYRREGKKGGGGGGFGASLFAKGGRPSCLVRIAGHERAAVGRREKTKGKKWAYSSAPGRDAERPRVPGSWRDRSGREKRGEFWTSFGVNREKTEKEEGRNGAAFLSSFRGKERRTAGGRKKKKKEKRGKCAELPEIYDRVRRHGKKKKGGDEVRLRAVLFVLRLKGRTRKRGQREKKRQMEIFDSFAGLERANTLFEPEGAKRERLVKVQYH